jgi:hypothetical protein
MADLSPRSSYGGAMSPSAASAPEHSGRAAPAAKDWLHSPITYVVAGLVILALGITIPFLLPGGSSKSTPTAAAATPSKLQPVAVALEAPDHAAPEPSAVTPAPAAEHHATQSAASSHPIYLLPMADLNRDALEGGWFRQPDGSISCDGTGRYNRLVLPYQPPAEYDLRVAFTITGSAPAGGDNAVLLIFTDQGHTCTWVVNSGKQRAAGFNLIDGKPAPENPTFAPNHPIRQGERHTLLLKVRKNHIEGYLDWKRLSHFDTTGAALSINPGWQLGGNQIALATMCPTSFHAAELVEVNGEHGQAGRVK